MPETQLWRRVTETYEVELLVGNSWVLHERFTDPGRAQTEATRMAMDASVRRVRVLATHTTQTCTVMHEQERPVYASVPAKFTLTGEETACRACSTLSRVASDTEREWVFCTACPRAYPR